MRRATIERRPAHWEQMVSSGRQSDGWGMHDGNSRSVWIQHRGMARARRAVLGGCALPLVLLLAACSQAAPEPSANALGSSSVSGTLYLVNDAGEVRVGAANRVYAIPREERLLLEWDRLCARDLTLLDSLITDRNREVTRLHAIAQQERDGLARTGLLLEVLERRDANLKALIAIAAEAEDERNSWIASLAADTGQTGVDGNYRMALKPGAYWLFAELRLNRRPYRWMVPLDLVADSDTILNLDNTNTSGRIGRECRPNPFASRSQVEPIGDPQDPSG